MRLGAFPVSIETKAYMRLARNAGRSAMVALVRESLGGNKLILGVDRLDYSKGIPDRVKAFERLLENNPEWRGNVTLLQVTPKSRSDIKQYGDIESELTGLIGKVNGQFGDRPGRRSAMSTDPIRARFWRGFIAPPTSPWSRRCATA